MNGSCSPASFGGSCIGTPKECKDCSSVTRCDDSAEQEQELEQNGQSWEVTREVSLVKKVADGIACITTCDNWPYQNCKVRSNYQYQLNSVQKMELRRGKRDWGWSTCISPFSRRQNLFSGKAITVKYNNYPE